MTDALSLRPLTEADAPFVLRLLTDAGWLRWIGDRGVHSLDEARAYVRNGPQAMDRAHGAGLRLIEVGGAPAGLCGLLVRDGHAGMDLGFAVLPAFRGRGLATLAGKRVLDDARARLGLRRVSAFVSPGNAASVAVLARLGFVFEQTTILGDDAVEQYGVAL